jgi:hypothetical protein
MIEGNIEHAASLLHADEGSLVTVRPLCVHRESRRRRVAAAVMLQLK